MAKVKKRRKGSKKEKVRAVQEERLIARYATLQYFLGPDFSFTHPKRKSILGEAGIDQKKLTTGIRYRSDKLRRTWYGKADDLDPELRKLADKYRIKPSKACLICETIARWYPRLATKKRTAEQVARASCPVHKLEVSGVKTKKKEPVPEPEEECPVRRPEPRDTSKKLRMLAIAGEVPVELENAKWKTLRDWAEACRDHYEERDLYATLPALFNLVRRSFKSQERILKAIGRLKAIYAEEWLHEDAVVRAMVEDSLRRMTEEKNERGKEVKKRGRDDWGFREKTRAAAVNAVLTRKWKSAKQVQREAKVSSGYAGFVRNHLNSLVKKKLVARRRNEVGATVYRRRKG